MSSSTQRNRNRPNPVSCQSCRSKKLKCNRVQPCSNCAARGITCNFLVLPRQVDSSSTAHSNAELLARIEQLEAIVLRQSSIDDHTKNSSDESHGTRHRALTPNSGVAVVSDIHQNRDEDSQLLENVGTREDSLLVDLSNGLTFRISETYEFPEARDSAQYPTPVSEYDRSNRTIVTFPVYRVAVLLFQSYETNVDYICRFLHVPTVRSLLKTVYLRLNLGEDVQPGQAALLLAIFALAAFFYRTSEISEVATTEQESIQFSKYLCKSALDVLDYSRRITSGTVEDVQAYILMTFATFHLDGFSARGRFLSAAAISIARDLRLHLVDAEPELPAEGETGARNLVDREVKRRVFWMITSSDWLLSTVSGPQQGMYLIHPNHMNVKLPRDCNDDDVVFAEVIKPVRGPQPTGMTYFLERIRLAHLCREIADAMPLEASKLEQMPYDNVIAIDKKLVDFISNLPFFFRLDPESRRQTKPLEALYPNIPLQRYCITRAAHSRRCKLHQRFLLRQSSDPRYAYSRRACVDSARAVISFYDGLSSDCSPWILTARMGIATHFMHLALGVLVMDLCFNKNEIDEVEIKAEVKAGLQMFEDTQHISPLLGRFLSSLRNLLQKHRVYLHDSRTSKTDSMIGDANYNTYRAGDDHQMQFSQHGVDIDGQGINFDMSFDEFWHCACQNEPNPDLNTWDNLFSALDTRPL